MPWIFINITVRTSPHISHINILLTLSYLCQNSATCHFSFKLCRDSAKLCDNSDHIKYKKYTPIHMCMHVTYTVCVDDFMSTYGSRNLLPQHPRQAGIWILQNPGTYLPNYMVFISEYHNVKQTYPYSLYYRYALSTASMSRSHSLNCLVGCHMV